MDCVGEFLQQLIILYTLPYLSPPHLGIDPALWKKYTTFPSVAIATNGLHHSQRMVYSLRHKEFDVLNVSLHHTLCHEEYTFQWQWQRTYFSLRIIDFPIFATEGVWILSAYFCDILSTAKNRPSTARINPSIARSTLSTANNAFTSQRLSLQQKEWSSRWKVQKVINTDVKTYKRLTWRHLRTKRSTDTVLVLRLTAFQRTRIITYQKPRQRRVRKAFLLLNKQAHRFQLHNIYYLAFSRNRALVILVML